MGDVVGVGGGAEVGGDLLPGFGAVGGGDVGDGGADFGCGDLSHAADDVELLVGAAGAFEGFDGLDGFVFGGVYEAAGVDEDEISEVWGGDGGVAEVAEGALQADGVDGVFGAAEGGEVVPHPAFPRPAAGRHLSLGRER